MRQWTIKQHNYVIYFFASAYQIGSHFFCPKMKILKHLNLK